jgi:hypothetical protein
LAIFEAAHRFAIYTWLEKIPYVYDYKTKLKGYKQKSYKIMIMKMFAILDKAKPDIESIRGLNFA